MREYIEIAVLLLLAILSFLVFYEMFRVQSSNGVVSESRILNLFNTLLSLTFPLLYFQMETLPLYLIFVAIAIIVPIVHYMIGAQRVTVYETSQQEVLDKVKLALQQLNIPFEEGEQLPDEHTLLCGEEQAKLKISWWLSRFEARRFVISIKKARKVQWKNEFNEELQDLYRQQREDKLFWKQIVLYSLLGCGVLAIGLFMINQIN